VDNLLWHGQVLDPDDHMASTEAIRKFTHMLTTDSGWITSIVPVRDGVLVARRL
jgi:predicted O-methyltransferase YrrM